tara:strand:- start:38 stop:490 length:453 start_codon:yes stop_codon:yes gene_type:complete
MDKTEEFDALKKLVARFQENPIEFKSQFTPRPEPSLTRSEKWDRIEKLWDEYTELVKQEGKEDEIIRCMDSIIQMDLLYKTQVLAWINKGKALYELGRPEEAIECFDKAIELDPKKASAWYNKGTALTNLGRPEEAIECFDKASFNKDYA